MSYKNDYEKLPPPHRKVCKNCLETGRSKESENIEVEARRKDSKYGQGTGEAREGGRRNLRASFKGNKKDVQETMINPGNQVLKRICKAGSNSYY